MIKIKYPNSFVFAVETVFDGDGRRDEIMKAIKEGKDDTVRFYLEDKLDESDVNKRKALSPDVYFREILRRKATQDLYDDYMELLLTTQDIKEGQL